MGKIILFKGKYAPSIIVKCAVGTDEDTGLPVFTERVFSCVTGTTFDEAVETIQGIFECS